MKGAHMTWEAIRNSKVADLNKDILDNPKKDKQKKYLQLPGMPCKQVQWMWSQLAWWSLDCGIEVVKEHKFHPERKWRFDFFIKQLNVGVEYEGIFSDKSRHTSKMGFTGDVEKYREAAKMGITVFRYTAKDYKNVLKDIDKLQQ